MATVCKGVKQDPPGPAADLTPAFASRPSRPELYERGKNLRTRCPRSAQAVWQASDHRPDPLGLLIASSAGRIPELIPIRYGRMMQSPFAFYRGAALNMAADLAGTPTTGLRVQACGDCHLLNFGAFATPERREIFDINDFDETLPGPWEWDVKRLAASFVLACRHNSLSEDSARDAVLACVRSYREHMAEFSAMPVLDVCYARIDFDTVLPTIRDEETRKRLDKRLAKLRNRHVAEHDYPQLVNTDGQAPTIKDNPPLIYHLPEQAHTEFAAPGRAAFACYRETLQEDRRLLLDRFTLQDIAIKVVGVGSVGTWCGIVLLLAGPQDPLFLQVKEARVSVLEAYAGKSVYPNHGQRVVNGCRRMQSASDLFLGWTEVAEGRHFYIRQLKDMKIKLVVEAFNPGIMVQYAELCGWTLARAHARSGEPAEISGYLGKSDNFDQAIASFAVAYADQTEKDHEVLKKAVREGHVVIELGK
jgi:uncharacterized protein (DUF2252 family)